MITGLCLASLVVACFIVYVALAILIYDKRPKARVHSLS